MNRGKAVHLPASKTHEEEHPVDLPSQLKAILSGGDHYPEIEELLSGPEDAWAVSTPLGRFLARLIVTKQLRSVLEFGAGRSSAILAKALSQSGGGQLTSIDHQEVFCRPSWKLVEAIPSIDARLVISRLRPRLMRAGCLYTYVDAAPVIASRSPFDLVLIDAPPGIFGRDAPLHLAYEHLADGALIVLDDAARVMERTTVRRWLRRYEGLEVVVEEPSVAQGVVVLRKGAGGRTRFSIRSVIGSFHDRILYRKRQVGSAPL
jgi:predicted O-methyltransferase YrrM